MLAWATIAALLHTLVSAAQVSATTFTVCPQGPPTCQFATIQAAVDYVETLPILPHRIEVRSGIYRERVQVTGTRGLFLNPFVITAIDGPGTAVVDGSDLYVWTQESPGLWFTDISYAWSPARSQVFVDSTRYKYIVNHSPAALPELHWTAALDSTRAYIKTGGLDPNVHDTGVTNTLNPRQRAFELLNSDFITIDGFTTRRCREEGIRNDATIGRVQGVVVKNCRAVENGKRGIHLEDCMDSSIENNRARDNGGHGIHLFNSTNCTIARNLSYRNNDPRSDWGGVAGIKVGSSTTPDNVSNVAVDYNVVYENEDTGIDLNGASNIFVRRNASYRNGDHGYDNLATSQTTFLNNVAVRNNHDGISIESDAYSVKVHNCVFAYNALEAKTLVLDENVAQLFVAQSSGFTSNNNIFVGDAPAVLWQNLEGEPRRRTLVQWLSTECDNIGTYWTATSGLGLDLQSYESYPAFLDTAQGNFVISAPSSMSIDRGKADVSGDGWLAADPRGFGAHDVYAVSGGSGNPPYSDIGTYEYDALPGGPTIAVGFGYNSVAVSWTARGDDGSDPPAPDKHEVLVDGVVKIVNNTPPATGTYVVEIAAAPPCQEHAVVVRVTDHNGQVAYSNTVSGSTCCSSPCEIERPGRTAARAPREAGDWPLELGRPQPNPARGSTVVSWSIPRSRAGESYELSLFDVEGRRVSVIAEGSAKAGKFAQELGLARGESGAMRGGVFFLRLRVGSEVHTNRIVVLR